jgi:hypothetical protein
LKDIPPDRVRLHVCWGNSESPHDSDVLPTVSQAKVGALYLPFAGPRHAHEFRCFEQFPLRDEQLLIAGVMSMPTSTPTISRERYRQSANGPANRHWLFHWLKKKRSAR